MEKGIDLSTEPNLVLSVSTFWFKRKAGKLSTTRAMNTSSLHLQRMKVAARSVTFVDSHSIKMRISPIKLQGGMFFPRMVASSGEKCVQLTFLKNLSAADQAKAMKAHGLKIVKLR